MKKIVIILLLILPFVLTITITIAGRIISITRYINVEKICFVDDLERELDDSISVEVGTEKELKVKVYPEYANNKEYTFYLDSVYDEYATITDDGTFVGLKYGTAEVQVFSKDNNRIFDKILIKISADNVSGLKLFYLGNELNNVGLPEDNNGIILYEDGIPVSQGGAITISYEISPNTALNKSVNWVVSDEEKDYVSFDNGKITINNSASVGRIISIKVVSLDDESIYKMIKLKVVEKVIRFKPVDEGQSVYVIYNETLNLNSVLEIYKSGITYSQINYSITSGAVRSGASITGTVLTVDTIEEFLTVEASVEWNGDTFKEYLTIFRMASY